MFHLIGRGSSGELKNKTALDTRPDAAHNKGEPEYG